MGFLKIVFFVTVILAALIYFRNEEYKQGGIIVHEKIDFLLRPVFNFYNEQGWTFLTPKTPVLVQSTNQSSNLTAV